MLDLLLRENILQSRLRHPRLYARTSPAGVDNSDGNIHTHRKVVGKEVCRCRHIGHALGRSHLPLTLAVIQILERAGALDLKHTDLILHLRSREDVIERVLHGLAVEALDGHLHIALARAYPHVTDQDILKRQALTITDLHRLRLERSGRSIDLCKPITLSICRSLHATQRCPRRGDRNLGVRRSLTPKVYHSVLLQDHIVAQNRG